MVEIQRGSPPVSVSTSHVRSCIISVKLLLSFWVLSEIPVVIMIWVNWCITLYECLLLPVGERVELNGLLLIVILLLLSSLVHIGK